MPVPCTVALHCELPPGATVAGLQLTATDVIVDPAVCGWTVTVAVPDFVASCALVAVTVTLPAHPSVSGTIHVRAVNLQLVRVSPTTAPDLTLALGQTVSLTVQLMTAEGQPFVWPLIFTAGISPWSSCGKANPQADLGSFSPSGRGAGNSDTLLPDAQGKVTLVYAAPTRLSVQGDPPGSECQFGVGASPIPSPGGFSVNAGGGGA